MWLSRRSFLFFFFKQKTAYEMRISDWSSDVCSSDLQGIDLLLDATHPYAAQISHNAAHAARACSIPCWALRRPAWQPQAGDDWREVADWAELIQALQPFHRPLFTLGRDRKSTRLNSSH